MKPFTMNEANVTYNITAHVEDYAAELAAPAFNPCAAENDTGKDYATFYRTAQFVTGLICYPIICLVGLTGNTLTLIVLQHKKMLTSTNVILSALAVADTIKILNDVLYFLVSVLMRHHPVAGNRMLGYMYPTSHYIFNEAVCVTAWLTVCVAIERYISVCHATRAKELCTVERARIVSALVFISMSLLAVPSALRYTKVTCAGEGNSTFFAIAPSRLGRNKEFMTVYTWVQNLLRSLIPLFVLIILNTCIINALRRERVKGKKLSGRNRITLMLLSVVLVFLICITPDAVMSTFFGYGYVEENFLVKGIREITDMLLAVNSAVNFIIYVSFSKMFRDIFVEIFCRKERVSRYMTEDVSRAPVGASCRNQQHHLTPLHNPDHTSMTRLNPANSTPVSNGDRISIHDGEQTFV